MRNSGSMTLLGVALIALIAGGIGFALGVGAQAAPAAAGVAAAPVVYGWPWFGFPFFGLIFGFFFLFVIFAVIRRLVWGGRGGPGGRGWHNHDYGYRSGSSSSSGSTSGYGRPMPPFADEMLKSWHSQAHGEQPPMTQGSNPPMAQGSNPPTQAANPSTDPAAR